MRLLLLNVANAIGTFKCGKCDCNVRMWQTRLLPSNVANAIGTFKFDKCDCCFQMWHMRLVLSTKSWLALDLPSPCDLKKRLSLSDLAMKMWFTLRVALFTPPCLFCDVTRNREKISQDRDVVKFLQGEPPSDEIALEWEKMVREEDKKRIQVAEKALVSFPGWMIRTCDFYTFVVCLDNFVCFFHENLSTRNLG